MKIKKGTSLKKIKKLGEMCNKCGHCCSMGSGFAQKDELEKIADHLKITIKDLHEKYFEKIEIFNKIVYRPKQKKGKKPFGPCVFLKDKGCVIHEIKPIHCQVGNCNQYGNELSEWYSVNYLVDKDDPESIRQWSLRVKLKSTIEGGKPLDLVDDKNILKEILEYKKLYKNR